MPGWAKTDFRDQSREFQPNPAQVRQFLKQGEHLIEDMIISGRRKYDPIAEVRAQASGGYYSAIVHKWKNGILPVVFEGGISEEMKAKFFTACAEWAETGVVSCVEKTNETAYLVVSALYEGCWSHLGSGLDGDIRRMNLAPSGVCWNHDTLLHEQGHAFGFIHEHQRADRDLYVEVHYDKIADYMRSQFDKVDIGMTDLPYDHLSIMHYSAWAGAANYGELTMTGREPLYSKYTKDMGLSEHLTPEDKRAILYYYTDQDRPFYSGDESKPPLF